MTEKLTLTMAQSLIASALAKGRELQLKPLTVVILDAGGHIIAAAREDGASNMRVKMAEGKANGALSLGLGSRAIFNRAQQQPYFIQSMNALADGALVPVPGGVLIRANGAIIGAIGITGDQSDHDEACAVAAIESLGLTADPG